MAHEIKWLYALPQFLTLAICLAIGSYVFGIPVGLVGGAAVYLAYSYGSRGLVAHHHRRGITLMRRNQWAEALECFEQSERFFERWAWIDRFRPIVLMSPSGASYREMAMINQAVCKVYLDRAAEARQIYDRVLELYPASPLASSALKLMDVGRAS